MKSESRKYVKFTGKFRDLIPQGYKFYKLFAQNYRCYNKECGREHEGDKLWIWQHLGGYLEIRDLFSNSFRFVEGIISGEYVNWEYRYKWGEKEEKGYWLHLNIKTGEIITYENHRELKHKMLYSEQRDIKEYSETFREVNLSENMIQEILRLNNAGMIEVCKDKCPK